MNNFFLQLKTIARTIRLSTDEKQRMRVALYTYLKENPAESLPMPSTVKYSVPSPYTWYSPRFAVPLSVVLILGLGSGTAFAAQSALPGTPLYAVKVNVNEPVQVALATTPEAKAQVNAQIATTRLEEAETLAANGKLDASTSAALASNFTAHATAAVANTNDLSENDPGTAVELGAQFSSTLAAHGAILAQLSDDTKGTSGDDNSNAITVAVRAEQHDEDADDSDNGGGSQVTLALATGTATNTEATATPAVAPAASIRTFAAKTNGTVKATPTSTTATSSASTIVTNTEDAKGAARDAAITASLQTQASTSIATALKDFTSLKPQLDQATAAQVQAQITNAQAVYAQGSTSLAAGNVSAAKNQFSSVIRMTVKLDTYLKVGKKINIKLLSNLLGVQINSGSNSGPGTSSGKGKGTTVATSTPATPATDSSGSSGSSSSGDGDSNGGSGKGDSGQGSSSSSVNVNLNL